MTKVWRLTSKGAWPVFTKDVIGDNLEEAVKRFVEREQKQSSSADAKSLVKVELIGDTQGYD